MDNYVYNPLNRGLGIGRRTGKVIQKKRNVNNGVENFDDYFSSSDGEISLSVTVRSSPLSAKENVSEISSPPVNDVEEKIDNHAVDHETVKQAAMKQTKQESQTAGLFTRNQKFGRRTGKDLLAGKEHLDLNNFSNYLSDVSDMTASLVPTPESAKSRRTPGCDQEACLSSRDLATNTDEAESSQNNIDDEDPLAILPSNEDHDIQEKTSSTNTSHHRKSEISKDYKNTEDGSEKDRASTKCVSRRSNANASLHKKSGSLGDDKSVLEESESDKVSTKNVPRRSSSNILLRKKSKTSADSESCGDDPKTDKVSTENVSRRSSSNASQQRKSGLSQGVQSSEGGSQSDKEPTKDVSRRSNVSHKMHEKSSFTGENESSDKESETETKYVKKDSRRSVANTSMQNISGTSSNSKYRDDISAREPVQSLSRKSNTNTSLRKMSKTSEDNAISDQDSKSDNVSTKNESRKLSSNISQKSSGVSQSEQSSEDGSQSDIEPIKDVSKTSNANTSKHEKLSLKRNNQSSVRGSEAENKHVSKRSTANISHFKMSEPSEDSESSEDRADSEREYVKDNSRTSTANTSKGRKSNISGESSEEGSYTQRASGLKRKNKRSSLVMKAITISAKLKNKEINNKLFANKPGHSVKGSDVKEPLNSPSPQTNGSLFEIKPAEKEEMNQDSKRMSGAIILEAGSNEQENAQVIVKKRRVTAVSSRYSFFDDSDIEEGAPDPKVPKNDNKDPAVENKKAENNSKKDKDRESPLLKGKEKAAKTRKISHDGNISKNGKTGNETQQHTSNLTSDFVQISTKPPRESSHRQADEGISEQINKVSTNSKTAKLLGQSERGSQSNSRLSKNGGKGAKRKLSDHFPDQPVEEDKRPKPIFMSLASKNKTQPKPEAEQSESTKQSNRKQSKANVFSQAVVVEQQTKMTILEKAASFDTVDALPRPSSISASQLHDTPKAANRRRFKNVRKKMVFSPAPPPKIDADAETEQKKKLSNADEKQAKVEKAEPKRKRGARGKKKTSKSQAINKRNNKPETRQRVSKRIMANRNRRDEPNLEDLLEAVEVDVPLEPDSPEMPEKSTTEADKSLNKSVTNKTKNTISPPSVNELNIKPKNVVQTDVGLEEEVPSQQVVREFMDGVAVEYTQPLKSASGKKKSRGRRSRSTSGKRKSSSSSVEVAREAEAFASNDACSPVVLRLINSLPSVTPQSGVSFRQSTSRISMQELNSPDPDTDSPVVLKLINTLPSVTPQSGVSFRHNRSRVSVREEVDSPGPEPAIMEQPSPNPSNPISTPCSRPTSVARTNGLHSCLKSSSAIKRGNEKRRVRISNVVDAKTASESDGERSEHAGNFSTTSYPDSPIHYAETTHRHSTGETSIVLPNLDHLIVRPESNGRGLRRSQRTRVKPVADYKGEYVVYRRDSAGFGCVIDRIQPSIGEAKVKEREERRKKNLQKRKYESMKVPAKQRRLSTHVRNMKPLDSSQLDTLPAVNPDTDEEVIITMVSRGCDAKWYGSDLNPVYKTDPVAACMQLKQNSFSTGKIHIRAMAEMPLERSEHTLVFNVIHGKVCLTINEKATVVQSGDDFFVPRGSAYGVRNLRRDVAILNFVNLQDGTSSSVNNV